MSFPYATSSSRLFWSQKLVMAKMGVRAGEGGTKGSLIVEIGGDDFGAELSEGLGGWLLGDRGLRRGHGGWRSARGCSGSLGRPRDWSARF